MSKLETVRRLNDSEPQLEIVKNMKALQQTVSVLQAELKALPDAVASETSQALEPLRKLEEGVRKALEAFDQVTEAQRRTWSEMAQEMARKASQSLSSASEGLRGTLDSLKASSTATERTAEESRRLIEQQAHTSEGLRQAALILHSRLESWWTRAWTGAAIALFSGLIAASAVVLFGMNASSRSAQPGAAKLSAEQLDLMRRGRAFNAASAEGNQRVKDFLQKKFEEQEP